MEATHENILGFIKTVRESFIGSETVYTCGSCYHFYLILKQVFPSAVAMDNEDHVITEINGRYYDIYGEAKNNGHNVVTEYHFERGLGKHRYDIKKGHR